MKPGNPSQRAQYWWFVAATAAITPIDVSQIGLIDPAGPDIFKWLIRLPFWYLPLAVLVPRWGRLVEALRRPPTSWLAIWAVFGAASVAWAVAPDQALLIGVASTGLVLVATWYVYSAGWEAFVSAVVAGLSAFIAVGLVVDLLESTLVDDRATGISTGPTSLGRIVAINLVLIGTLIHARGFALRYGLLVIMCATVLVFTETRTAYVAIAVGILYGTLRPAARLHRVAVLGALIIGAAALFGLSSQVGDVASLGERGDPTSIAGRTSVWPVAIELIRDRPLLGYGSGASEPVFIQAAAEGKLTFRAGTSHSIVFSPLISGGVVGFTLLVAAFLSAYRARKRVDHWVMVPILVILVGGLTEAIVHTPSISLFVLAGCLAALSSANRWTTAADQPLDDTEASAAPTDSEDASAMTSN